jgi:hypothetical protein
MTLMKYSLRSLMTFSIRDLFWVTVVVALTIGWWLERQRAEQAVQEAESSQALSDALTVQLQNKNPAASIEIHVNGRASTTSTGYGAP